MIPSVSPFDLPVSLMLALWAPVPSSYGCAAIQGPDGAHDVIDDEPNGWGRLPLDQWLGRARPISHCVAFLPLPADPLPGLGTFLEAGECVYLSTPSTHIGGQRNLFLVPQPTGTSVTWHVHDSPFPLPPCEVSQARRDIHRATEEAISTLLELDLARERPDLADMLNDLVTAVLDPRLTPPWLPSRSKELLERSLRLSGIVSLALDDDGAAVSSSQLSARRAALEPLAAVARRGIAAGTQYLGDQASSL